MADRRLRKTDEAIRAAFLRLLFSIRYETISMSRIAADADVSRSTLYQHYRTREDILHATMTHIIDALADALAGCPNTNALEPTLDHFWENRRLSRAIFGPPVEAQVRRWLAHAIEQRLGREGGTSTRIDAITGAAGAVALLDHWLTGHLVATRADIAGALIKRS